MQFQTVLFDFDGTLADSENTMLVALNTLASSFGFEPVRTEEFASLRELSARVLVTKRLGIPLWRMDKLLRLERKAKEEYAKRSADIRVFAKLPETIAGLREAGYEIGIVTSAPQQVVERVLKEAGVEVDFIKAGVGTFGKPRAIRAVLRSRQMDKADVVYVGDELRDLEACKKVRIAMLGVSWGLNSAEALRGAGIEVVSTPDELLNHLS